MPKKKSDAHGPPEKPTSKSQYVERIKRYRTFIILALLASLGVFAAVAVFGGFSNVINLILSINLSLYLLAFGAVLLGYFIRFCKWSYYLRKMNIHIPLHKSFAIYMSGASMNLTPGRVGRVVTAYTIEKVTDSKMMEVAPIITMDSFTDFFGFAILAIVTAFIFKKFIIWMIICALLLSILFMFLLDDRLYRLICKFGLLKKYVQRFGEHIETYYQSQNELNTLSTYIVSFCFTVPADLLNAMALYFTLSAMYINPPPIKTVFVFSVAQMFGMISTLPGSIGVADATIVALLKNNFGITSAVSSAATILTRLATLWFPLAIGAVFLIYTIRYWNTEKKNRKRKE